MHTSRQLRLAAAIALALAAVLTACAQTTRAVAAPTACGPVAEVTLPDGVNLERLDLLDQGKHYRVYAAVEASDGRAGGGGDGRTLLPSEMGELVDISSSSLERMFVDSLMASRRVIVHDMRTSVTADHSDVLVTAKFVDAVLEGPLNIEGGRRAFFTRVKLSVQAKNLYTGENLLPADVQVEGRTGLASGDRVVVTAAESEKSVEVRRRIAVDYKKALSRAFDRATDRLESLLRPVAKVLSVEGCTVDLFGGGRNGLQRGDELVVFRAQRRQLGEKTLLASTRPVALMRCDSVAVEQAQCRIVKSVAGYAVQDGDYAVMTNESLERTRIR